MSTASSSDQRNAREPLSPDRNLLFGVLALQLEFIDERQFAQACSAWAARKDAPLADVLKEFGWLKDDERREVERVVERKLKKHGGDVRRSLAEVADEQVRDAVRDVGDDALRKTISTLPPASGYVLMETMDPAPEQRSRYTLTRLHGEGGLGQVWVAHDNDLQRDVAFKQIKPGRSAHPEMWRRFLKEAQVTGQLEHPNIVPVYELGRKPEDNQPFYTMRFVRGQTLREAIKEYQGHRKAGQEDPLERRKLLQAFITVCRAINYAHDHGVIHRDLKPDNVVLGRHGEVVVLDWGLAKVLGRPDENATLITFGDEATPDATHAGQALGTPGYMAPEQADGRIDLIDARTDIYGLGAMLFEILTGKPPHHGADTAAVLRQIVNAETPRARALDAATPPALDATAALAMAKAREDRYQSAAEVADDVERWLADEPVTAYPEPFRARVGRWVRRHRALVLGAAGVFFSVAVVSSVLAVQIAREKDKVVASERIAVEERNHAEEEQQKAEAAERQAVVEKNRAEDERKKAEAAERVAVVEKNRAEEAKRKAEAAEQVAISQFDLSYDALGDLVLKIQIDLDEAPGGRHVRRDLLEDTMKKLHRLHESPATSDRLFRRYASAHMQLGEILWGLNRRGEAEQEYIKAGEYAERAFAAFPTSDKAIANIAANHNRMGDTELFYHKRIEPARKNYEAALPLWEGLAKKMAAFPDGDPALPELERINLVDAEEAVADTYDRMGILTLRFDFDYPKAEEWFGKSLAIRNRHLKTHPSRQHRVAVGASYIYLAEWALQHNELTKALSLHEELLKQREGTFAERRWSLKAKRELADAHGKYGDDLLLAKRNEEGHKQYIASRDLFQQVMAAEPDDPMYRGLVAHAHYRCGTSFLRIGDPKGGQRAFEEGYKLRKAVYDETPDEKQKINMLPQFMLATVRVGKHAEAAQLAASVRKNLNMMPIHLAEAGSCFGLCMAAVAPGKKPEDLTPEENKLRQEYLKLALACFDEARAKKYDDILFLSGDADLDPLQSVPEYQKWLADFRDALKKK